MHISLLMSIFYALSSDYHYAATLGFPETTPWSGGNSFEPKESECGCKKRWIIPSHYLGVLGQCGLKFAWGLTQGQVGPAATVSAK